MSYRFCGCLLASSHRTCITCCMYSLRLLMTAGETVRNMYSVVPKENKFEILCIWLVLLFPMALQPGGGPWPPLQCASKPLDSLLCLSIHLNPSSSGPWTRDPATSFLVFLFVMLHTAFHTSFLELRCLAFFLCDLATVFFGI